MKIHKELIQGTDDWLKIRCGVITASRFSDVLSKGKGKLPSKTRLSYLYDLIGEKMTGEPADNFTSQYMQWGSDTEHLALAEYKKRFPLLEIETVGFVELTDDVGCSPDAFAGDFGLVEIKCPKTTTQIQRWLDNKFPSEYMAQVQGQMWVCNREWTDFVSYDPRIKTEKDFFIIRVERDDEYIKNLTLKINEFILELNETLDKLL